MTRAWPPTSSTSRAAASRPARPRASNATLQPCLANSRTVARPMPADAPVITTISGMYSSSDIADAPHGVAHVVGDDQRAGAVDCHTDGAAAHLAVAVEKAGDKVGRNSHGTPAGEADEHHFVAVELGPVPAAVLADERAAAESSREARSGVEGHSERRDV